MVPPSAAAGRTDALGRRIAKLIPNGSNWDRTDYYYSAGPRVIEERFAENQVDPDTVASDPRYQYVWGMRYVHAPVLRDEMHEELCAACENYGRKDGKGNACRT